MKALIVGDGTGLEHLKERASHLGVLDRVHFAGRVPHDQVPLYINLMDVCVSTQTNDSVGRSRTTAKLPEYLSCGRFVVATDVGGAAELISGNGELMPYEGIRDEGHPKRLAEKIAWLVEHPEIVARGHEGVAIAGEKFQYSQLTARILDLIKSSPRVPSG